MKPDWEEASRQWVQDVGRIWWFVVVGLGVAGLVADIYDLRRHVLLILVVVEAVVIVGSFLAYQREYQRRTSSSPAHIQRLRKRRSVSR